MKICCWRFAHPALRGDLNIAVFGQKRVREFSNQMLALTAGMRLVKQLVPPPSAPIRHVDGGRPYRGGEVLSFEALEVEATAQNAPEVTVEIVGRTALVGVPVVMLPQLAALVSDSARLQLADESWMQALVADESASLIEGRLRVWTWAESGLVFGE